MKTIVPFQLVPARILSASNALVTGGITVIRESFSQFRIHEHFKVKSTYFLERKE
jgi:hypothetical protein